MAIEDYALGGKLLPLSVTPLAGDQELTHGKQWWARGDSNSGPPACEADGEERSPYASQLITRARRAGQPSNADGPMEHAVPIQPVDARQALKSSASTIGSVAGWCHCGAARRTEDGNGR